MKRAFVLAFAVIWIVVPHSLLAQTTVAASITHLEQAWADAQKAGDAANVAPLLADNFINTDVDGNRSGKSELLSNLKGGKWEQNEISDVKVSVYGDTAIATGAWARKGGDRNGTRADRGERGADTGGKMKHGSWQ